VQKATAIFVRFPAKIALITAVFFMSDFPFNQYMQSKDVLSFIQAIFSTKKAFAGDCALEGVGCE
jgi:hypothetical protein